MWSYSHTLAFVVLQSCNVDEESVEAAVSRCMMLETLDVRFCPKVRSTFDVKKMPCIDFCIDTRAHLNLLIILFST